MTEPGHTAREPGAGSPDEQGRGSASEPDIPVVVEIPAPARENQPAHTGRGSLVERGAREIRPRRNQIGAAFIGAVAAALLMAASVTGWRIHSEWRLGRIELTNYGIPLAVRVLSGSGEEPIGDPTDLVTRSTLALPDGDYPLRVSAVGRLSETFRFAVNRGETQTHRVALERSRLLKEDRSVGLAPGRRITEQPMLFAAKVVALEVKPGVADMIEWDRDYLIRRDGATGRVVWDARRPATPFPNG